MKFSDFLCVDAIIPELCSMDRDGVIEELVTALYRAGCLKGLKAKDVIGAVIKREKEASTGIGKGVAVPHVKYPGSKEMSLAVGRSSAGVDFSSLDKQPVYSVMLLISPAEDPDKHLQAMEKIFKYLQQENFRKFLRQSETVKQIVELLHEADDTVSF
ncbi:MAG: PTS sugar transporter subunit IIA [Planctomycetota bacterium]